jgi:hypothetical protein
MSFLMVLQFREEMEVWDVFWVVKDSETKAANLSSRSCARVKPRVVLFEENLYVRTMS